MTFTSLLFRWARRGAWYRAAARGPGALIRRAARKQVYKTLKINRWFR
jgi:hypothetical protein